MISFYVKGGFEETSKLLKALKIFTLAESLGGVESIYIFFIIILI